MNYRKQIEELVALARRGIKLDTSFYAWDSDKFRGLLHEQRVSMNSLAKDLGVNTSTVRQWVEGDNNPTLENYLKVLNKFKIGPRFFK